MYGGAPSLVSAVKAFRPLFARFGALATVRDGAPSTQIVATDPRRPRAGASAHKALFNESQTPPTVTVVPARAAERVIPAGVLFLFLQSGRSAICGGVLVGMVGRAKRRSLAL